jgi:hypothetical protein
MWQGKFYLALRMFTFYLSLSTEKYKVSKIKWHLKALNENKNDAMESRSNSVIIFL